MYVQMTTLTFIQLSVLREIYREIFIFFLCKFGFKFIQDLFRG